MYRRILALLALPSLLTVAQAQQFKLFDRNVQVHDFVSQGYVYTSGNNWLTMETTSNGSAGMTDMGMNVSTALNDRLRIGAQVYDRELGQLGQWHPSLDWAMLDFRYKPWLNFRGGKVIRPALKASRYCKSNRLPTQRCFALASLWEPVSKAPPRS
jgi:hypothetical protein